MSREHDALIATQLAETARQVVQGVRRAPGTVGLHDQLEAVASELCWEAGLVDVDGTDPAVGLPRLDHVGLLARDLRGAVELWQGLGAVLVAGGDAVWAGMRTAHLRFPGGGKLELLTPLGEGAAAAALAGRPDGVHHLTLSGFDVARTHDDLRARSVRVSSLDLETEHMRELFLGPRTAFGTAVQVVDRSDHYVGAAGMPPTLDEILAGGWAWVDGVPVRAGVDGGW
jgi:methylmalonyl-CoA/ethylmalonyl-CoA epimerase